MKKFMFVNAILASRSFWQWMKSKIKRKAKLKAEFFLQATYSDGSTERVKLDVAKKNGS